MCSCAAQTKKEMVAVKVVRNAIAGSHNLGSEFHCGTSPRLSPLNKPTSAGCVFCTLEAISAVF